MLSFNLRYGELVEKVDQNILLLYTVVYYCINSYDSVKN
jgi:hypothetical protein